MSHLSVSNGGKWQGGEVIPPKIEVNGGEGGVAPPPCVEMEVNGGSGGDEQVEKGHVRVESTYLGEGTTPPCLCRKPSKMNREGVEPSPGCHVTGGLSPPTRCHISVSKKGKKRNIMQAHLCACCSRGLLLCPRHSLWREGMSWSR